jgi:hypothetical protein
MTCYKFLADGATGPFSGFTWPAPPEPGTAGDWVTVDGPLEPCRSGLHLCRPEDLPFWVLEELYTVEVDGPLLEHDDFVIARRARLLRRVDAWGRDFASSFSRECAVLVRDLTAGALRRAAMGEPADILLECDTADEMVASAQGLLDGGRDDVPLVGYLQDAARFAASVASGRRWAADAATVGFIAATAARVGAEPGAQEAAVAHERARQATWLADHVLATV